MKIEGLHILLTYQCTYECDHCFVWGSPWQMGTLTFEQIENILLQAKETGVTSIYFEGGEPFLYYAILVKGVRKATDMGFSVGIVSNAYWANSVADAEEWLRPFVGRLADFTVSSDQFHCGECLGECPQNAMVAAKWLNIPTGMISIDQPEVKGEAAVMYRGRAAKKLTERATAIRGKDSILVRMKTCASLVASILIRLAISTFARAFQLAMCSKLRSKRFVKITTRMPTRYADSCLRADLSHW